MQKTNIPYADCTWNPGCGCPEPVSAGCDNCWATDLHNKRHKAYKAGKKLPKQYAKPFSELQQFDDRLIDPMHHRKPAVIAVQFMGDLFAQPFEFIAKVFYIMGICYWHTFQVLTKREKRMVEFFKWVQEKKRGLWWKELGVLAAHLPTNENEEIGEPYLTYHTKAKKHYYPDIPEPVTKLGDAGIIIPWPLPNVWLGVTAENQEQADKRIPLLLQTPAAKRFVSIEPCLGGIDLTTITNAQGACVGVLNKGENPSLDLVICGGESGSKARPMHPDHARDLRNQCEAAGVPFYFKQWGEWLPKLQTEWSHCTMTERKTKDDEPIYELFDCNDNVIATGITEDIGANKGAWIRCGKKKAGHLLDGVEHRSEF